MSVGEIAGLIAAIAFVLLVGAVAVPLLKLGKLIGSLEAEVVRGKVVPMLGETQVTIAHVNTNLANAEALTDNAKDISQNARALTTAFSATLGGPLVKVAAFSYGVRRAASRRDKAAFEKEVKAARKEARQEARRAGKQ